jgi:hypothetical protein
MPLLAVVPCLLAATLFQWAVACEPSSQQMHVCLHKYLERDFPMIEALLEKPLRYAMDGAQFQDMCSPIKEMELCYDGFLEECLTYPLHVHLLRVIHSVRGVYNALCGNNSAGFKDLIDTGFCIESARKLDTECKVWSGFDFPLIMAKMMRFNAGRKTCDSMTMYRDCFREKIRQNNCEPEALTVWNQAMNGWLNSWCHGIVPQESRGFALRPHQLFQPWLLPLLILPLLVEF